MAYPDVTPANATAAMSSLANNALAAGVTPTAALGLDGLRDSVLANLLTSIPATVTSAAGANVGASITTGAGVGITGGTGTICATSVTKEGGLIVTRFLIDLTGVAAAAAGDVIGVSTGGVAYIGRIGSESGTILGGTLRCFEAPAGGDADIDVYSSTAATGEYDDAISGLAGQTQVVNSGTLALTTDASVIADTIAEDDYLYLVSVGATAAAYTAGRICLTLYGVPA